MSESSVQKNIAITKQSFNDMVGKGWDSGAQYSFCIQEALKGNPQFWWVPDVLRKFPHPPGWESVKRNPDGTFESFPEKKGSLTQKLQKFALALLDRGFSKEAGDIISLLRRENE